MRALIGIMKAILLVATIAISTPAHAQWFHQEDDNPFLGKTHLAGVGTQQFGYTSGVVFTCRDDGYLQFAYVVPEKADAAVVGNIEGLPWKLSVIVDADAKVSLDATLELAPFGEQYRLVNRDAEAIRPLLVKAWKARRRFAVAVEEQGKISYAHSFTVSGSTRAIQRLAEGCEIDLIAE